MSHKILSPEKVRHDEDYEVHWNYTSFKDKVILDLGADCGSTANWFFGKEAKRVIAVECDENLYNQLVENYKGDMDVIPVKMKVDSSAKISELIYLYKPDLVKVDIEGYETKIMEMKQEFAIMPNEWLIEAHFPEYKDGLVAFFTKLNPYFIGVYDVLQVHILHIILRNERRSRR